MPTTGPRRYALVGTGHRAEMYAQALTGSHRDAGRLVALLDPNPTRLDYYQALVRRAGGTDVPTYHPARLVDLLHRERPDALVVCSPDATHADYVVTALDAGVDAVVEKPLTTDADGVARVLRAARRSSARVAVTFNYRYSPRNAAVRELLLAGAVGQVTSVTFEWLLDTVHGADYFRRWHRDKAVSGGLFVHKAAHHFDLVQWWLGAEPRAVSAMGGLMFYGAANARARGLGARPERSHGHVRDDDPFALDLAADPRLRALYLDAERDDGYVRDRDVFAEGISIEDNLGALVRYDSGATLTYSLNAHAPYEGYRVGVNGTAGRLELDVVERAAVSHGTAADVVGRPRPAVDPSATPEPPRSSGGLRRRGTRLLTQRHWEGPREHHVEEASTSHGGGDARMLDDLLRPSGLPDPLRRAAGHRDGALAVLVGIAANRSLDTGTAVRLLDLCPDLDPARRTTTTGANA